MTIQTSTTDRHPLGWGQHGIRAILPLTAMTLFLSAFLLFSIQPFFARMVLPRLGGTPAVWSVAMVFFQTALLAGYGYAHVLSRYLPLRIAVAVHIIVLGIAFIALPIAIPAAWSRPPADGEAWWLIGLFTVSVGLPFFAVSANGPLLQSWFARTGHPHAADPYFLYGASNIGSFASLILYVIAIEPLFGLSEQSRLWTIGYALLAGMIAVCGLLAMQLSLAATPMRVEHRTVALSVPAMERLRWVALAFVPSALLVAVTAHVSTDIAAAPFLWIVPLALFLLTFVLAFQKKPLIPASAIERPLPYLLLTLLYMTLSILETQAAIGIVLHFSTFFLVAMAAHGALARRRPAAEHLTEFYFAISLGGVLGGLFASLIAMHLFSWIAEYPLLLLASLFVLPAMRWQFSDPALKRALILGAGLVAMLVALRQIGVFDIYADITRMKVLNGALAAIGIVCLLRIPRLLGVAAGLMVVNTFIFMQFFNVSHSERSFFGVMRVENTADGVRKLQHGTTLHGAMRIADGEPASGRPLPLTYYTADGGLNAALVAARDAAGGKLGRVGIVGVGAGSLACQIKQGETMDLIEIDPLVMKLAKDPSQFRFLPACGAGSREMIGDGRLVLADLPAATYGALIIDAFSSDSVPVHMMTTEAIDAFMTRVRTGGLLIMHISNRHLDLEGVLDANARALGLAARTGIFVPRNSEETRNAAMPSQVVVLARSEADLSVIDRDPRWRRLHDVGARPWTDDYSNILASIWRKMVQ